MVKISYIIKHGADSMNTFKPGYIFLVRENDASWRASSQELLGNIESNDHSFTIPYIHVCKIMP